MANIIIGRVAPLFKGEFDSSTTYDRLDIVLYKGSSYVCMFDGTSNIVPTDETKWIMVASKGDMGRVDTYLDFQIGLNNYNNF